MFINYAYKACINYHTYAKIRRNNNKIIHIVCGISDKEVSMITVYYPDKDKWENGKRRDK